MKKAIVALVPLLALTAACGSGTTSGSSSLSPTETKVANNIASYVSTNSPGVLSKGQARCFGRHFVDKAGVSRLEKSRLVDSQHHVTHTAVKWNRPLAEDYVDSYFTCVDYATLVAHQMGKSDPKVDEKSLRSCLHAKVKDADAKELIVDSLLQKTDKALASKNAKAVLACQQGASK
jgi:hypothetical protein